MRTVLSTYARMIAVSLVLVATAAFVLQGAGSAQGHSHATTPVHTTPAGAAEHPGDLDRDHADTRHAHHSHDHGAHDHSLAGDPEPSTAGAGSGDSCCGKFCSTIACLAAPALALVKLPPQTAPTVGRQVPEGIGPSGLKRPPRTIGMI